MSSLQDYPELHGSASINGFEIGYSKETCPNLYNPDHINYYIHLRFPDDARIRMHVPCTFDANLETSMYITREMVRRFSSHCESSNFIEHNTRFCLFKIMDEVFSDTNSGHLLYGKRTDKSINAVEFFKLEYENEINEGYLTLSDLRSIDKGLWDLLRRPVYYASVASILPRGRMKAGRPIKALTFDPNTLDPNDERDALALRALRQREHARNGMRRLRAAVMP